MLVSATAPKQPLKRRKESKMKAGQTQKFECDTCGKEVEITLWPSCPHAEDATPELCPFCGGTIVEI